MAANILITGATGLVGSYLTQHLVKQGKLVRIMVRNVAQLKLVEPLRNQIEVVEGDILDIFALDDALEGISQVYHCAALVSFHPKMRKLMKKTNVEGTENVVNACLERQNIRLLHVSSVAALGKNVDGSVITEQTKWKESAENSYYARTKRWAELEVYRGIEEGLDAVIVQPSIVLGYPPQNHPLFKLLSRIESGLTWYQSGVSSYVDAEDVAKAMVIVMEHAPSGEQYLIGGHTSSMHNMLTLLGKALGGKLPKRKIPYRLVLTCARILKRVRIHHSLLNREVLHSCVAQHDFSSKKLMETFNFEFKPLSETIHTLAAQWKQQSK